MYRMCTRCGSCSRQQDRRRSTEDDLLKIPGGEVGLRAPATLQVRFRCAKKRSLQACKSCDYMLCFVFRDRSNKAQPDSAARSEGTPTLSAT